MIALIRKAKEIPNKHDLINPTLWNNKETQILPFLTSNNHRNHSLTPVARNLNKNFKIIEDMVCVL